MKTATYLIILLLLASCGKAPYEFSQEYRESITAHQNKLLESRKKNYLSLVGLFKLEPGTHFFGSEEGSMLHLNIEDLPERIGVFNVGEDSITYVPVKPEVATPILISLDELGNSELFSYERWSWRVITRGGGPYLRVWDSENPDIESFGGFEWFKLNPDLIFDGQFTYFQNSSFEQVFSKIGVNETYEFVGQVSFNYNGENYTLDAGKNGFTMVSDATTGKETYEAGRYIYLDLPEKNGPVKLDFNKLYNPPCSFSEFTTCLIPPKQNTLPFSVNAGEKMKRLE